MQAFADMNQEDQLTYIQSLVPLFAREFELDVKEIENVNFAFNASCKWVICDKLLKFIDPFKLIVLYKNVCPEQV